MTICNANMDNMQRLKLNLSRYLSILENSEPIKRFDVDINVPNIDIPIRLLPFLAQDRGSSLSAVNAVIVFMAQQSVWRTIKCSLRVRYNGP
jgi:hypothetical protein